MPRGQSFIERFMDKVDFYGNGADCWLWTASKNPDGYGRIHMTDVGPVVAHRVSYQTFVGPLLGQQVLHSCDNPSCVNPDHLWLGTQLENIADREQKGRGGAPRGEDHPRARFTEDEIRAIRRDPRSNVAVAADYGVNNATISSIRLRKTWREVA